MDCELGRGMLVEGFYLCLIKTFRSGIFHGLFDSLIHSDATKVCFYCTSSLFDPAIFNKIADSALLIAKERKRNLSYQIS